jgi:hypothetical protein
MTSLFANKCIQHVTKSLSTLQHCKKQSHFQDMYSNILDSKVQNCVSYPMISMTHPSCSFPIVRKWKHGTKREQGSLEPTGRLSVLSMFEVNGLGSWSGREYTKSPSVLDIHALQESLFGSLAKFYYGKW